MLDNNFGKFLENNFLSDIYILLQFLQNCKTNCINSMVTCFHLCCFCHVFVLNVSSSLNYSKGSETECTFSLNRSGNCLL